MNTKVDMSLVDAVLGKMSEEEKKKFDEKFWQGQDVGIEHHGTKITLPAEPKPMDIGNAISALKRRQAADEQTLDIKETIQGYPYDAAVAFLKAMQRKYGWAHPVATPGFFGPINPDLHTVRVGPEPGDTIQVPIGSFTVPGVDSNIATAFQKQPGNKVVFVIFGEVEAKERAIIMELVEMARSILREESIYKGKALRLQVSEDGTLNEELEPIFLQTAYIRPDELVLPVDTATQVRTSLFTPIQRTKECLAHGVPLKRGILLEGPYGTGKTMTANTAARLCVENGWTYIMLDKVQGLRAALEFAKRYQPAVVFAEDIDRVTGERDEAANDLLNTIDGVVTKNAQVITVLTTNHVERINKAMLRPGRLDAVISILPPDAEAAQRLVRLYARGLVQDDEPLDALGEELKGCIPATIREVVERSKLAMIGRGGSSLSQDDLIIAAQGMKRHLELLNEPDNGPKAATQRLGEAMRDVVIEATGLGPVDGDEGEHAKTRSLMIDGIMATIGQIQMLTSKAVKASEASAKSLESIRGGVRALVENEDLNVKV